MALNYCKNLFFIWRIFRFGWKTISSHYLSVSRGTFIRIKWMIKNVWSKKKKYWMNKPKTEIKPALKYQAVILYIWKFCFEWCYWEMCETESDVWMFVRVLSVWCGRDSNDSISISNPMAKSVLSFYRFVQCDTEKCGHESTKKKKKLRHVSWFLRHGSQFAVKWH